MRSFGSWKDRVKALKRETFTLYLACRHPRVPWYAKILALLVVGYALSPIDLIPDFIPVIGYLDDLILIPLGLMLVIRMIPEDVLAECRQKSEAIVGSTFGRRAVNDGKLVHRLREGKRITIDTLDRIQAYIAASMPGGVPPPRGLEVPPEKRDPRGNFRFFENRQKYLLFVHTCSEKRVIAERVALELASIHPRPPALRVFDAGVGDGTVLARVMRSMHGRFPHMPFYIAGKELSLEDVRLTLDKVPDRLFEHPATVFVLTNMYYAEAPWLTPGLARGGRRHDLA